MKPQLLLAALLLFASPALAEDVVLLKCDVLTSLVTKQVGKNQVLEKKQIEEQAFLKVDTANSRVKINAGRWENVTIANGVVFSTTNVEEGGATIVGEFMLEFSPPGRLGIQGTTILGDALQEMSVKGACQLADEAAFGKALSQ